MQIILTLYLYIEKNTRIIAYYQNIYAILFILKHYFCYGEITPHFSANLRLGFYRTLHITYKKTIK